MTRRNPEVSPKARRLVERFAARVEDYSWMGQAHPEEHTAIERGYTRARNDLLAYIEELEKRKPTTASILPGDTK